MSDKLWKYSERRIAKRLGGKRIGNTGGNSPDILAGNLAIEAKEREIVPKWLENAVAQADNNAQNGEIPVVILHQKGDRYDNALVIMRLKHFQQLLDDFVN